MPADSTLEALVIDRKQRKETARVSIKLPKTDRGAFSALRVGASCMAMGQAAGAAAALAVRTGIPSREVPLDSIRKLLRDHGAAVPVPGVVTEPEYPEEPV